MAAAKAAQAAALRKKRAARAAFGYEDANLTGNLAATAAAGYQGTKTVSGS